MVCFEKMHQHAQICDYTKIHPWFCAQDARIWRVASLTLKGRIERMLCSPQPNIFRNPHHKLAHRLRTRPVSRQIHHLNFVLLKESIWKDAAKLSEIDIAFSHQVYWSTRICCGCCRNTPLWIAPSQCGGIEAFLGANTKKPPEWLGLALKWSARVGEI